MCLGPLIVVLFGVSEWEYLISDGVGVCVTMDADDISFLLFKGD